VVASLRQGRQKGENAVTAALDNPYLAAVSAPPSADEREQLAKRYGTFVEQLEGFSLTFYRREILTSRYAWAIPTEPVVRRLAELSPICDMGCGTGYWAWMLQQAGAEVLAVDPLPIGVANHWHKHGTQPFVEIVRGEAASFDVPITHTLMLCWPPYDAPMGHDAIRRYCGEHVIYVGEHGGCTADDAFHDELAAKWTRLEELEIPQWFGVHDSVNIYRRAT
jgi:hypothetical protein